MLDATTDPVKYSPGEQRDKARESQSHKAKQGRIWRPPAGVHRHHQQEQLPHQRQAPGDGAPEPDTPGEERVHDKAGARSVPAGKRVQRPETAVEVRADDVQVAAGRGCEQEVQDESRGGFRPPEH